MKRFLANSKWLLVLIVVGVIASFKMPDFLAGDKAISWQTNQPLKGAWQLTNTDDGTNPIPNMVKIIADNSFTFAAYDLNNKKFLGAGGGISKLGKGTYTETLEYLTEDSTKVGISQTYTYTLKGKILTLTSLQNGKKVTETWTQIDNGTGQKETLAGAWRIRREDRRRAP